MALHSAIPADDASICSPPDSIAVRLIDSRVLIESILLVPGAHRRECSTRLGRLEVGWVDPSTYLGSQSFEHRSGFAAARLVMA